VGGGGRGPWRRISGPRQGNKMVSGGGGRVGGCTGGRAGWVWCGGACGKGEGVVALDERAGRCRR